MSEDTEGAIVRRLRAAGCVFAEDEARLLVAEAPSADALEHLVRRREAGLPLEQVLGWADFCGLRIRVAPGVFVPRRRTEFLAELAIDRSRGFGADAVMVDLCCGSGAVAAAVSAAVPGIRVLAADLDPAAVACARSNLPSGNVFEGDLLAAVPPHLRGAVDVLACNAPYVPTDAIGTMPPEARLHEARIALDGGADGLDVQRRVAAAAREWVSPRGVLLVETSAHQADATASVFTAAGLVPRILRSDALDATVVMGARS